MGMFGVYIHIPFCLQRCRYCDFATYSVDQVAVNSTYVDGLISEIQKQRNLFSPQKLDTIYFGGGTPSLLHPSEIQRLIVALNNQGFTTNAATEITIEMNPATLDENKTTSLLQSGINRISVGAQTFHDHHLKNCGRKHNAQQTLDTVALLKKLNVRFSLDLLFALPHQSLQEIEEDVDTFLKLNPDHISPYCLTLTEKHPMNTNRPSDGIQTEMFSLIWGRLEAAGYQRYEISNFAKPGQESRHNLLYWQDDNYWGLGLSAHSYKKSPDWGTRFWNPSDYKTYLKTVEERPEGPQVVDAFFSDDLYEKLEAHQALTDFCHTSLRLRRGLSKSSLRQKFGEEALRTVSQRALPMREDGRLLELEDGWTLSDHGVLVSNTVFEGFLFLKGDIDKPKSHLIIKDSAKGNASGAI